MGAVQPVCAAFSRIYLFYHPWSVACQDSPVPFQSGGREGQVDVLHRVGTHHSDVPAQNKAQMNVDNLNTIQNVLLILESAL